MKRYTNLLYLLSLLLFFSACHNEEEWIATSGFRISLSDEPMNITTRTTPVEIGKPAADKFHLKIVNHKTEKTIYDAAYTSDIIPASTGTYSLTAVCGDNPELAWDSPYYEGSTDADVKANETASVAIPCSVANSLLSVQFRNIEKFDAYYNSYGVNVKVGNTSLRIEKNNMQNSAYFRAGSTVELTFYATLKENGQEVSMRIESDKLPAIYEAGTHTKLSLTAAIPASGTILTVDKVEIEKVTVSATIPLEWLPKPKVTGFNGSNTLTYTETADAPADAVISYTTSSPVQDVEFTLDFKDAQYTKYNKTYTLSAMTEEERTALSTIGIELPTLDGISQEGKIDLSALTANLLTDAGTEVTNEIKVNVKANNRWSSETGDIYQIKVVKPKFTISVYPGDIWTKEFTMNTLMESQVESGGFSKLSSNMKYQFSTDGQNWITLGEDLRKDGLQPGTKYYVRGLYREGIESKIEVTTYPIIDLKNGNMESWSYTDGPQGSWPNKGPFWKRWYVRDEKDESTEGWCTLNAYTTSDNDSKAYVSNSGTEQTNICNTGNYAAEIKTIGWGSGTTAASPISTIKRNTPGELFLGKIDNSNNPIYGYSYASKPKGIRFYYKYLPEGNHTFKVEITLFNGNDIIASNNFEGGAKDTFIEQNLDFQYDLTKKEIAITHLSIRFVSGENSNAEVDKASVSRGSRHVGNKLYIDDVSLIYDK